MLWKHLDIEDTDMGEFKDKLITHLVSAQGTYKCVMCKEPHFTYECPCNQKVMMDYLGLERFMLARFGNIKNAIDQRSLYEDAWKGRLDFKGPQLTADDLVWETEFNEKPTKQIKPKD